MVGNLPLRRNICLVLLFSLQADAESTVDDDNEFHTAPMHSSSGMQQVAVKFRITRDGLAMQRGERPSTEL